MKSPLADIDLSLMKERHVLNIYLVMYEVRGGNRKQLADAAGVNYKTFSAALAGMGYIGDEAWVMVEKIVPINLHQKWLDGIRGKTGHNHNGEKQ